MRICTMKILPLLFVCLFVFNSSCSNNTQSDKFEVFYDRIIKKLNSIESYQMNVLVSNTPTSSKSESSDFYKLLLETAEDSGLTKETNFPTSAEIQNLANIESKTKMDVKFKRPNLLYLNAFGTFKSQIIKIYTTFDGEFQKARTTIESGKDIQTNSITMRTSINKYIRPFDGLNLKGFGFDEGFDYIGTIENILNQYDFILSSREGNIIIFKGTLNKKKMLAYFSRYMPMELAEYAFEMKAKMEKNFFIKFDSNRDLIVGYNGEYESMFNTINEACVFNNITINQDISEDAFTYIPLPNEELIDITDMVNKSRMY